MGGYILELRNKYGHLTPKKHQHFPHKQRLSDYGATQKLVQPSGDSPPLNETFIRRVQGIVGALLYIGRAVNNKLLFALSAIGSNKRQQQKQQKMQSNSSWIMWQPTLMTS